MSNLARMRAALLCLSLALSCTMARAESDGGSVRIPAEYLIGVGAPAGAPSVGTRRAAAAAAGVERPAALDGSQYAVIFPIFTGADGNTSYLRLANGHSSKVSSPATPKSCYNPQ